MRESKKAAQLRRELAAAYESVNQLEKTLDDVRKHNSNLVERNEQLVHEINCGTLARDNCRNGDPQCYECALYAVQKTAGRAQRDSHNAALDEVMFLILDATGRATKTFITTTDERKRHFARGTRASLFALEAAIEDMRR